MTLLKMIADEHAKSPKFDGERLAKALETQAYEPIVDRLIELVNKFESMNDIKILPTDLNARLTPAEYTEGARLTLSALVDNDTDKVSINIGTMHPAQLIYKIVLDHFSISLAIISSTGANVPNEKFTYTPSTGMFTYTEHLIGKTEPTQHFKQAAEVLLKEL